MKRTIWVGSLAMLALAAYSAWVLLSAALTYAQQPNNEAQAIGQKLIAEINLNIQCNTSLLTLQQEVKRLKDKYEPEAKKD